MSEPLFDSNDQMLSLPAALLLPNLYLRCLFVLSLQESLIPGLFHSTIPTPLSTIADHLLSLLTALSASPNCLGCPSSPVECLELYSMSETMLGKLLVSLSSAAPLLPLPSLS